MSNGASERTTPAGWYPGATGKFARAKCGALPIADKQLLTIARWIISSRAMSTMTLRHRPTASHCAGGRAGSPCRKLYAAKR